MTGTDGPAAQSGAGGLLKFSMNVHPRLPDSTLFMADDNLTFLANEGADARSFFVDYAVATPKTFLTFATNVDFTIPGGGAMDIQLFHNGVAVADFITIYGPTETGVKMAIAPAPESFAAGDTFFVRIFTADFEIPIEDPGFWVTAVIGL